ncbi:MAG: 3-oxoacyl-[acyl-carrier-protein] reductase [Elusimicrobiota bacterium]|jgi:3-oxoacyl-[acyl-carrier protein] reductase
MSARLKGRVAMVTGAAQGIGRAVAAALGGEGADLVLLDMDAQGVEEAASALKASCGVRTLALSGDVRSSEDCEKAVRAALDNLGRIDILVNNAGVTKDGLLVRMTEDDWNFVLDVNLKGVFLLTKAAAHAMIKARWGRVVNIASVVGEVGNAGQANYAASKGGVIAFTKACAKELASRNILVNAVAPGLIRTRMTQALGEEWAKKALERIPLGRFGEPDDVAKAVLYLACDSGDYVTGQVLGINGGMRI